MTAATRTIRIAPSVLAADFGRLGEQVAAVEAAGADCLHVDVMDGHFVPNLSIGVPVVASLSQCTKLPLDTHLMITDPAKYAPAFAKAGAAGITFHAETVAEPHALIRELRDLGVRPGVALNPGTPAERVFEYLDDVDLVLVMTVWPGFGGQRFMPECLDKIAAIAPRLRPEQWLQVDGGIDAETIGCVVTAGADTLVAGTAIFRRPDPGAAVQELRRVASAAAEARKHG